MKKLICICLVLLLLSGCSADIAACQSEPAGDSQTQGQKLSVSSIAPYGFVSVEDYSEYLALFQTPANGRMAGQDWGSSDRFELYCEDLASGVRSLTVPYLGEAPMTVDHISVYDAGALYNDPNLHETWFGSRDTLGISVVLREYAKPFSDYAKELPISDFLETAHRGYTNYYNYISEDMVYGAIVKEIDICGIPTEVFCYRERENLVMICFLSGDFLVEIWDWGGKGAQELLAGFSLQPLKEIP